MRNSKQLQSVVLEFRRFATEFGTQVLAKSDKLDKENFKPLPDIQPVSASGHLEL
jgi:hypothetical protein